MTDFTDFDWDNDGFPVVSLSESTRQRLMEYGDTEFLGQYFGEELARLSGEDGVDVAPVTDRHATALKFSNGLTIEFIVEGGWDPDTGEEITTAVIVAVLDPSGEEVLYSEQNVLGEMDSLIWVLTWLAGIVNL